MDAAHEVLEDFLIAMDEMTSNAVRHGQPPVDVRLWISSDRVVCTITDRGPGWGDPFAGYGPAHGEDLSHGGMGLWLARQLFDHVDISAGTNDMTVRLTTRIRRGEPRAERNRLNSRCGYSPTATACRRKRPVSHRRLQVLVRRGACDRSPGLR